jgi:hypothetical protein
MPARKPLAPTYGRWTLLQEGEPTAGGTHRRALCRCACGIERWVAVIHLRSGASVSCGCFKRELSRQWMVGEKGQQMRALIPKDINVKHGACRRGKFTAEYMAWHALSRKEKTRTPFVDWLQAVGHKPGPDFCFMGGKWVRKPRNPRRRPTQFNLSKDAQERIDRQLKDEKASADAWAIEHAEQIPKVLGYMLDRPTFVAYDSSRGWGQWAGLDGRPMND